MQKNYQSELTPPLEQIDRAPIAAIGPNQTSDKSPIAALNLENLESIISKDLLTVSPDLPLEDAIGCMSQEGDRHISAKHSNRHQTRKRVAREPLSKLRSSCILVVENSKLVGILTAQDILSTLATTNWQGLTVGEVMTQPVITIQGDHTVDLLTILNLMQQHQIHHLPVIDAQNRPVGTISTDSIGDVFDPLTAYRTIADLQKKVERLEVESRDRKSIEEALQQSETNFRAIFEKAAVGVSYSSLDGNIVLVNQKYADTLGYSAEELLLMSLQDITYPADLNNDATFFKQLLAGKINNYSIEKRFLRKDGSYIWIDLNVALMQTGRSGDKYCISSIQDISDRKRAEDSLRQQFEREQLVGAITRRVRKSLELEQILSTTVEQARQVLQSDRVLVYQIARDRSVSVVAEAVTPGWSHLLHTRFSEEAFPSECLQSYLDGHITYIADRKSDPMLPCMSQLMQDFQIEAMLAVPIVQKENEHLWGLLIAHQCSKSREWQSWEVTLQLQLADQLAIATKQSELYQQLQLELNERKRAEEQLRQTNDRLAITNVELARATRLKDEFLANMSHELRTPLNAILGMSEGLLDEDYAPLVDKQKKAIGTIAKSGRHLLDLINDILDLAKIEAGKLDLQIASVDLERLCDSSMSFVKPLALKKNIALTTKISKGVERNFMDERRMRQVLINLLSNAVKFTADGGNIALEVSVNTVERDINFRVIDTGMGIAPEDIQKLFETFIQIDSSLSRRHDGTGLGLALVRRIAELHGGRVSVESEVGKGSQFTVSIPWWQSQRPGSDALPLDNPYSKVVIDESTPSILIAQDGEDNIEAIANYLRTRDYQIVQAQTGEKVVEIAENLKPQLILIDVQIPNMDGLEAIRRMRLIPALQAVPIIAISSIHARGDRERCLKAGANEYFTRPFALKQLLNLVGKLLNV
jgi:PAS domain S-box-containing protein